jgi:predicted TIM-barrel fold metal-dependent hydrolase
MLRRRDFVRIGMMGLTSALYGRRSVVASPQLTPQGPLTASQPRTTIRFAVPSGTCDTHVHVFGDQRQYPFAPTAAHRCGPATPEDLNALHKALRVDRVVVIQPFAYGADNRCILDGAAKLGSRARAVVVIDGHTSDNTLEDMHNRGARGLRLNIDAPADGALSIEGAAQRLRGRAGWHINALTRLETLQKHEEQIAAAGVPIVLDHWVYSSVSSGPAQAGFASLQRLLKTGQVYVKITHQVNALGTTDSDFPTGTEKLVRSLLATNPRRLLWGTDWPHVVGRPAGTAASEMSPFRVVDDGMLFNSVGGWLSEEERQMLLVSNPAELYGF